jgi:hypothetical protein
MTKLNKQSKPLVYLLFPTFFSLSYFHSLISSFVRFSHQEVAASVGYVNVPQCAFTSAFQIHFWNGSIELVPIQLSGCGWWSAVSVTTQQQRSARTVLDTTQHIRSPEEQRAIADFIDA